TRIKEICREAWSFVSLETIWRDLRYGGRTLAKNPGFTAVAVLATALGIGVNTGIFSVLNGVALKLLPVPRANQLVSIDQVFDVLGERPTLGRTFVEADCRAPGASPVVVLSDDLWRSRFGADPKIVGKSVSLNRANFMVIGVAAPGFRGLDPWPSEFWAPVTM